MTEELKSITYYLPKLASKHSSILSVVLITDGENISRGIAIKSPEDNFNRKRGRAIAKGRAMKAFSKQKSCNKNNIQRQIVKAKMPLAFTNKCSFMPELTDYEHKLLTQNT